MESKINTYIFLTNNYMPRPGGTGMCVHAVAKELVSRGDNVFVICYDDQNGAENLNIDGVNVIKIATPFFLKGRSIKSYWKAKMARIVSLLAKLIYFSEYPLRSRILVRRYKDELKTLLTLYPQSVVISTFTPIEAEEAVMLTLKRFPSVCSVFYSTDTLSNEVSSSAFLPVRTREKLGIKWEQKIFGFYDKIIIMECHQEHYKHELFKPFWGKMVIANFPLLQKSSYPILDDKIKNRESFSYSFVYAGALYNTLRNPSFLCELIIGLSHQIKLKAEFYGGGDCTAIMSHYQEKSKGIITYHGLRSHEEVSQKLQNADILLSIGNKNSPMMPSKIFEYMAMGKPIIHIYTWDKDPCLGPLKLYGNSLLINESIVKPISDISKFIKNAKEIEYEEVLKKFKSATPAFTADIIKNI